MIETYTLTDEQVENSLQFARDSVDSSSAYYKERGQEDIDKIKRDICNGKLAEYGVYIRIINEGIVCSKPDLTILPADKKSFSPDLITDSWSLHVKSCEPSDDMSWVFQKNDPLTISPAKTDVIFFCSVSGRNVDVITRKSAASCLKLYQPMRSPALRKTKHAIYFTSL